MSGEWDNFDCIILGTSLKECLISGLLSSAGKRVLHLDRNPYYGGESASLNLQQLYKLHKGDDAPLPKALADEAGKRGGQYCIDASPKFLMGCDMLVQCLAKLIPEDYMEYTQILGSFVYNKGALHKVPSSAAEGLSSSLLGMFMKVRFRTFANFATNYDVKNPSTHDKAMDVRVKTTAEMYSYFNIDQTAQTFISHAVCLQPDEKHLKQPALPIVLKFQLYVESFLRFGNSPYIYPRYGLGGLAEAFSRISSVFGGTFITDCKVQSVDYDANGNFVGVHFTHSQTGDMVATGKQILGDPSYFAPNMSAPITQIARSIFIMSAPIKAEADNCQIIIPGCNAGRTNDVYISCLSGKQSVCPMNRFLAVVSASFDGAGGT